MWNFVHAQTSRVGVKLLQLFLDASVKSCSQKVSLQQTHPLLMNTSSSLIKSDILNPFIDLKTGELFTEITLPDYFTLFHLPKQFPIDLAFMEEVHDDYMLEVHPDMLTLKSPEQQNAGLRYASFLQEAKNTLTKSFSRAIYLLGLIGHKPLDTQIHPPHTFIMKIFDLQERFSPQDTNIIQEIHELHSQVFREVTDLFEPFNEAQNDQQLYQKLCQAIGKIKFAENLTALHE